jgi:hypothetical protein
MSDDGEWHIVTASEKKRVIRSKGRSRRPTKGGKSKFGAIAHPTSASVAAIDDVSCLERALKKGCHMVRETDLYKELLSSVLQAHHTPPREILCYGLGNFSKTHTTYFSASFWQLACLIQMRQDFRQASGRSDDDCDIPIHFFDPASTTFEKDFLSHNLSVYVLAEDEQRCRKLAPGTLAFLPHCPAMLYENLMRSNPDAFQQPTSRAVWIGNSMRNFCDALTPPPTDISLLRKVVDLLDETLLPVGETSTAPGGDFERAFNDTYVICAKVKEGDTNTQQRLTAL